MGKCYNSIVVNAPIEKVWNTIKNFHDMSWGSMIITKVEVVGKKGGMDVGAKRILNDAFHETLVHLDENDFTFSYSIDDGLEPVSKESVSNYIGVVKLYPITDSNNTFVEWRSIYESTKSSAVNDFCNPLYANLLASLKSNLDRIVTR